MAATAAKAFEHSHIVKTPGVRGGKARIDGTRICVVDLVHLLKRGLSTDEMRDYHSDRPLTLAEVHSALAYYYDNAAEIEAEIARDEQAALDFEQRKAELLARRGSRA
jgi:uncharacterized protein (DUF433 family)